ncbi:MAG: hypothetical protein Q4D87_07830 [Actinomycetaceae bacterium]|nr:hypothetical protein [Actinomycetaceae bacterium]
MFKGKVLVALLVGAVVAVLGMAFAAIFIVGNSGQACAEARERFETSKEQLEGEATRARTTLNYLNDENSFGYQETEEGSRLIASLRDAVSAIQNLEASECSSRIQAEKLSDDANLINEDAARLADTNRQVTEGLIVHASGKITETANGHLKKIEESRKVAAESLAKAHDSEGYGQVDGSLELLMNAQHMVDSQEAPPTIPTEIATIEDLRAASTALDKLAEQASGAEHSAQALKQSIDKYAGELEKQLAQQKAEEEAAQQQEDAGCTDVIVVAEQCTSYELVHYLASNGWSVGEAIADAQAENCQRIAPAPNPCSR